MGGGECKKKSNLSKVDRIKYPYYTTISFKNIKNSVHLNLDKNNTAGCDDIWKTDVREKHIRNRRLLDLPFKRAKCCTDIYNVMVDRQKLKKLQKYGLSRPVRKIQSDLEPEKREQCIPSQKTKEKPKMHVVEEFYNVPDSDSDEEKGSYSIETCQSGSLSECSGCSTLGGRQKLKVHVIPKLRWQTLLHANDGLICKKIVPEEMTKYKGRPDAVLKLQKNFMS